MHSQLRVIGLPTLVAAATGRPRQTGVEVTPRPLALP